MDLVFISCIRQVIEYYQNVCMSQVDANFRFDSFIPNDR